jgi:hypothetical protein
MTFPQINAEQVTAMTDMAEGEGAISVVVPDVKQDTYENYNLIQNELCDLNQLVILGLLKDITGECTEKLDKMYTLTKRQFRVFEITQIGQKMFENIGKRAIQ